MKEEDGLPHLWAILGVPRSWGPLTLQTFMEAQKWKIEKAPSAPYKRAEPTQKETPATLTATWRRRRSPRRQRRTTGSPGPKYSTVVIDAGGAGDCGWRALATASGLQNGKEAEEIAEKIEVLARSLRVKAINRQDVATELGGHRAGRAVQQGHGGWRASQDSGGAVEPLINRLCGII